MSNSTLIQIVSTATSIGSQLYLSSAIVLFLCIMRTASIIFKILVDEIESVQNTLVGYDSLLVVKWKLKHVLICQLYDHINDCFGLALLVYIVKQFLNVINYVFYTVDTFNITFNSIMICTKGLKTLAAFFFVTILCDEMESKVLL